MTQHGFGDSELRPACSSMTCTCGSDAADLEQIARGKRASRPHQQIAAFSRRQVLQPKS